MPRSRSNLGRRTRSAKLARLRIQKESAEERELRLAKSRECNSLRRKRETPVEHELRLSRERDKRKYIRSKEMYRRKCMMISKGFWSNKVDSDMIDDSAIECKNEPVDSDMNDDSSIAYNNEPEVIIGEMSVVCEKFSGLLWKGEAKRLCCSLEKVKLEEIHPPPEPLHSFQLPLCKAEEGS